MHNPYRDRKSRKLLNGCLAVVVSFFFIGMHMFMTTWAPYHISERSLLRVDSTIVGIGTDYGEGEKHKGDDNDDGILHVITTRFMQDQPKLYAIGKARLRLFETFCLPTMLNQEADNFLWFVMTDPKLDHDLLLQIQALLESRPNFYLVASNAKLLTPANLTSLLARYNKSTADADADATTITTQKLILTGDIKLLFSRMFDTHRPLLIETRLDADDGLHKNALSQIQKISRALPVDTRGWQIICSNIHYEWRNDEIVTINTNKTKVESSGKLRVVKETICVTPGYSLARHRQLNSIEFPAWPRLGHNLIAREWSKCMIEDKSIILTDDENNKQGNATHDCWIKMGYYPSALRSRTITSAGMSRINTDSGEAEKYENQTKMLWTFLQRDFGVKPKNALLTSQYIKDNLESIVLDNLKGQCTFGHSCKNSSKIKLKEILSRVK